MHLMRAGDKPQAPRGNTLTLRCIACQEQLEREVLEHAGAWRNGSDYTRKLLLHRAGPCS